MASTSQSAADTPAGFLGSPRAQRWLMGLSAAVFVAGLAVFLALVVFRGQGSSPQAFSTTPAQTSKPDPTVPPSKAAYAVGREFMEAGVLGKDLDKAWTLVGPQLKAGLTRKQWDSGTTTIVPYPAGNVRTTAYTVVYSHRTEILATVDLVAQKGSTARPELAFFIKFDRAGGKPNGRWLVTEWEPDHHPKIPVIPNS